ncbi:hypothetical protein B9Z55_003160 [Caenorhabditis nigoni]|uniref:Domain of unknown function WSN domain-containing protein n=1 Tax=Caenorhabditis nigoni TaxID=1611254 RepID=A0A2G5VP67_9PELO|nr:hypothetical protein B9Z55_003160 [Caenorhabditis nigoni]
MKFQSFILLALVGFGASQSSDSEDSANGCLRSSVFLIDGEYSKEALSLATDILSVLEKIIDNLTEGNFDGVIDSITELPLAFGLKTTLQTVLTSGEALLMDLINVWAKIFDPYNKVKECVGNVLETIITSGNFTREALGAVSDGTLGMCQSVKCLTNEVRFLQEDAITDKARELAVVLHQEIVQCYKLFLDYFLKE